jgi:hypothetical protein
MAKAKVTHSTNAVQITFNGDRKNPEPETGVIQFPGGHIEVSRCTDNTYWVHVGFVSGANIVEGRIDRANHTDAVEDLPDAIDIIKIAVRVNNTVPHFDPN